MKKIWKYTLKTKIDHISISESKNEIFLSSNNNINCFDLDNNKKWDFEIGKKAKIITSTDAFNTIAIPVGMWDHQKYVYYFDKKGNLLWKYKSPFGYHINDVDMDSNGNLIVIGMTDKFVVLNNNGKVKWEKKLSSWKKQSSVQSISISNNSKYIAIVADYSVMLFDIDGNEVFNNKLTKYGSPYGVQFGNNSEFIAVRVAHGIGITNGGLYLLNIKGDILWNYKFNFVPWYLDVSSNGKYILAKKHDKIYLFNYEGKLLNKLNIEDSKEVFFSNDGKKLFGFSRTDYFCYDISKY